MAMRHEMPEKVVTKVVKGLVEDVVFGSKWLWGKMYSCSFDYNFDNLPQLTKTVIMSPTDIPDLGGTLEDDFEDEEVMVTDPSLCEGFGKLPLPSLTGKFSSTNIIVGDTVEDTPCLQNESVDEASKDMFGSKVFNLYEGTENLSSAETHFSVCENVAKHVHNDGNTIAKLEDNPSVYYHYPSSANSQEVVAAVPVLEAVDSSSIEPIRHLLPLLPKFDGSNLRDGNVLSRNSILDPIFIPRIEEDEFIYNLPNAVVHKGSKLYEASSGVWVAEPIVQKPLYIDKY